MGSLARTPASSAFLLTVVPGRYREGFVCERGAHRLSGVGRYRCREKGGESGAAHCTALPPGALQAE